jgi:hypothetical protein
MTIRRKQHRKALRRSYWDAPPYREIQSRIAEGLREQLAPPKDLPHRLLTALMQQTDNEEIESPRLHPNTKPLKA